MNVAYNADCLAAMREMPDNAFDLAVVDPPYGDAGGETSYLWTQKRSESTGLVERGRRNSEKNHRVGRSPGTGIL